MESPTANSPRGNMSNVPSNVRTSGTSPSRTNVSSGGTSPRSNESSPRSVEDDLGTLPFKCAFVTGSTGLLGNNLVRLLLSRGVKVKALARSLSKAKTQFNDINTQLEIVEGDIGEVEKFSSHLLGCDIVFHTAAYFRDNYKGGSHWPELYRINVVGTQKLMESAYNSGIRIFVHTSSIAVLKSSKAGELTNESMERKEADADEYYKSKMYSDLVVKKFAKEHPDMHAVMVLPGWMFGPADIGPTSSGQLILDYTSNKLPGIPPGSFSVVDARDVADAQIRAAIRGRSGERYLAAGRHMDMVAVFASLHEVTGVQGPTTKLPLSLLYAYSGIQELYSKISHQPVLLSLASVRLMAKEAGFSHYDHTKSERELGVKFRPATETLRDTVRWYRDNGYITQQ